MPERPELIKLLELHNTNRIDYNNRKWETIKLFESVYVVLMAATAGALVAASQKEHLLRDSFHIRATLACLSVAAALAVWLGYKNLYRESRLLFREEYQMFKLARLAGFDVKLDEAQRWLEDDEFLLPEKWRSSEHGMRGPPPRTVEERLKARMRGHVFADIFRFFFVVEAIIACFVATLVLAWPL